MATTTIVFYWTEGGETKAVNKITGADETSGGKKKKLGRSRKNKKFKEQQQGNEEIMMFVCYQNILCSGL